MGGISVGSVISLKFAEIDVAGIAVPEPVVRLIGLTGVGVAPGVPFEIESTEICPVSATLKVAPEIPYRICGA